MEDSFQALEEAIREYVSDNYTKYKGFSWIPANGTDQAREFADQLMFCSQVTDMNVDQGDLVAGILGNLFDVNVWMFEEAELYQVTEERDKTAPVRKDIFLTRSYPKGNVRYFWVSHIALQAQMCWEEQRNRVKAMYNLAKLDVGSLISHFPFKVEELPIETLLKDVEAGRTGGNVRIFGNETYKNNGVEPPYKFIQLFNLPHQYMQIQLAIVAAMNEQWNADHELPAGETNVVCTLLDDGSTKSDSKPGTMLMEQFEWEKFVKDHTGELGTLLPHLDGLSQHVISWHSCFRQDYQQWY